MTKMRIGIIGLGMAVGPHAKSLIDLADEIEVAGAFSPSRERREAFAARFGFPLAGDVDTILADRSVDAVLLLTPPNTHLDLVERAAKAGKHVLLEKPVEISLARAEATVAACREAGVTLGIVLQHRFRKPVERLGEILASGRLGRMAGASAEVRNWRPQSYYDVPGRGTYARDGGGVLLTQAIHTLDALLSLSGLPDEVAAYAATSPVHRMEAEDIVGAAMRFADGAIGTIGATTAAYPGHPDRIDIIGDKGAATISGLALDVHFHDGSEERIDDDGGAAGGGGDPMAFDHGPHRALIADFVEAIRTGGQPRISGAEALKVHILIDVLTRSAAGRRPVAIASGG
jgi:UDP-N-acetyl-2-amino-2-deoxyglucuronate dehydrogenase